MKRVLMLAAVAIAAMGLTGCGVGDADNVVLTDNYPADIFTVKLEDGRTMDCIFIRKGMAQSSVGGPSCDWENAK
jgi:hypothetical protein